MAIYYIVNGKKLDPNGKEVEELEDMTADEVLEAVDSGDVSETEALTAEKKRDKPRKTVTEALE